MPCLGPQSHENAGRNTLMLDLDETLVWACCTKPENYDFMIHFTSRMQAHIVYVKIRPGARAFLEKMSEYWEVILFTASGQRYADAIVDVLDPKRRFAYRLYRKSCCFVNGACIKDLSVATNRLLSRILLVDNNPECYSRQLANGMPIKSYRGEIIDTALSDLTALLLTLSQSSQPIVMWECVVRATTLMLARAP